MSFVFQSPTLQEDVSVARPKSMSVKVFRPPPGGGAAASKMLCALMSRCMQYGATRSSVGQSCSRRSRPRRRASSYDRWLLCSRANSSSGTPGTRSMAMVTVQAPGPVATFSLAYSRGQDTRRRGAAAGGAPAAEVSEGMGLTVSTESRLIRLASYSACLHSFSERHLISFTAACKGWPSSPQTPSSRALWTVPKLPRPNSPSST
mmetsp:Transcript_104466/g.261902  ORF Transcript_104466/g.261902 Transcript_104466/m.261902 type:complete len:205 (-) Transcript_104466:56-670(-)